MTKTLSIDTRIELCGIYKGNIKLTPSNKVHFQTDFDLFCKTVIIPYSFQEYDLPLYCYGLWNKEQYNLISHSEMQQKFNTQDEEFERWLNLCKQLERLLGREKEGIQFYSANAIGRERVQIKTSQDSNSELNRVIFDYLKSDLIEYEKIFINNPFEFKRNINLESIKLRIRYANFLIRRCDSNLDSTQKLISHMCIQQLSLLIRLHKILKEQNYTLINDVKLHNDDFYFISSFLEFFGISAYIDMNNTSTKARVMKERFENFPAYKNKELKNNLEKQTAKINKTLLFLNKISES